jgi:queuosine biosynthesis protein QueD
LSEGDVWQRFTVPATRVVQYAQEEARKLGGSTVGTEHILLGLRREGDGIAARVLERLGVSLGRARSEIHHQLGSPDKRVSKDAPMTWSPKAKRVLELALEEAGELNPRLGLPHYIDTEHILLGLIREGEGQAARVLRAMEVDLDRVRREVVNQLGGKPLLAEMARPRPCAAAASPLPSAPVYELTVETEFSAAHSLKGYDGPCAGLHGHNYRVVIHIAGEELDKRGMLLDFREIKAICESAVSELDHKHLNDLPMFTEQNPTAENIARHIFRHVAGAIADLPGLGERKLWVVRVAVYESAKSGASYGEPFAR